MNNGTRVIPPAAVPTSSPLASAKDARAGNASLSFALHEVIAALSLRSLLSIFVMYGSYMAHAMDEAIKPNPVSIVCQ